MSCMTTLFLSLQITRSDIRPHIVIAYGPLIFSRGQANGEEPDLDCVQNSQALLLLLNPDIFCTTVPPPWPALSLSVTNVTQESR